MVHLDCENSSSPTKGEKSSRLLTYSLYAFGFLDLFAVAMLVPNITRHATQLGGSPTYVGLSGSIYGTLQLLSSPLVGRWSDVSGRRRSLLICLFFTSLGYILMGVAPSIFYYLLARIPLGIFKHSVSITKAILTQSTPKEERAKTLGYFNGFSSMGFIVGPLVGGHLAELENGFFIVTVATSSIFAFCFLVVLLFLRDHHCRGNSLPTSDSVKNFMQDDFSADFRNSLQTFRNIIRSGPELFFMRFLQGLSATLFRSNFMLILEQKFQTTPAENGRIISFGSIASASCALGVGHLVRLYGDVPRLYLHANILRVVALVGLVFVPNIYIFMALYFLLSMTSASARVCITNLSIERGKVEDTGAMLGLSQSLMSVCRTVSPLVAGVTQEVSMSGPIILSFVVSLGNTALVAVTDLRQKQRLSEDKKNP
ncbi:major facilitator superfamily domain-containing protein 9-like [Diadema antillarum]|uniref:major facilitator superfamily domain-containing protein 9-like n=1 Tax=Diadema antillarum TaxID=105358 RepID=UPI003A886AC4